MIIKTKFTLLTFFVSLLFTQSIHALTYTVDVPEETKFCYIIGEFNDWAEFIEMERVVGETNTYTIEIPGAAEGEEIGFYSGPSWGFKSADSDGVGTDFYGSGHHVVEAWLDLYDPEGDPLVYTVNVPEETVECYISGAFNSWGFTEMQRVGDSNTFTVAIPGVSEGDEVAFTSGPHWAYEAVDEYGNDLSYIGSGPHTVVAWLELYDPNPSSSIKAVELDVLISGNNNQISISDISGEVSISIYSLEGYNIQSKVVSETFTSQYLENGVYIVQINRFRTKVLVN